jgi:hypothetical protein
MAKVSFQLIPSHYIIKYYDKLKNMSKFELGYKQAVAEIVTGIVTPIIINAFASTGLLPTYALVLLSLIVIVENIVFILSMSSWGILYTLGWLFGSFIFFQSGLLGPLEFILYIILPIIFLVVRFVLWIKMQEY